MQNIKENPKALKLDFSIILEIYFSLILKDLAERNKTQGCEKDFQED